MAENPTQPQGERLRKAVRWLTDTVQAHPERPRRELIREAEIRFDLTPRESEFLEDHFS